MFKCSMCGEMLEDDAKVCSFCKFEFSETAKKKLLDDRISESYKVELAAVNEHKKRSKRGLIISIIAFIVFFVGVVFIGNLSADLAFEGKDTLGLIILFSFFAVWLVAYIVALVKSGSGRCPHCEQYLGRRQSYLSSFCRNCGKRIRFDE